MRNAVELAERLVGIDTIAPPANESKAANFVADLLEQAGFAVERFEFAPDRHSILARLAGRDASLPPLAFTGHLDTVPLGTREWTYNPFGQIANGKLYGRGASDMKGGVAAFLAAALDVAAHPTLMRGLELILTAGEETGCRGALDLARKGALGKVSALVIAEPTSNRLAIAHKGALHLRVRALGKTAHGSMPEAGENAITLALTAVAKINGLFPQDKHPLLGRTTATVTTISGGQAVNIVPDRCEFTIDIRTIPGQSHRELLAALGQAFGADVEIETPLVDLPPMSTAPDDPFIGLARSALAETTGRREESALGMPYFTDGSALQPAYGCPTIILGPGEAAQAHQTDEWCEILAINKATEIYKSLIARCCAG